jgi:hypothetical protein
MAATALFDPFSIFFRKIGYSVGLESTLTRIADLESQYLADRDLTATSWKKLRLATWQLSTDNIADVFESLGYIAKSNGDVLVCDNLDATALAHVLSSDLGCDGLVGRQFILLLAILLNDGEIFLNQLSAGFSEEKIKQRLVAVINHKREILFGCFPSVAQRARICRAVTIERQLTNRGSKGGDSGRHGLLRTTPLAGNRRTTPLDNAPRPEIAVNSPDELFSEDYFRKVPPRRKDWAKSLGLWDTENGLTSSGERLLTVLQEKGYAISPGTFVLWPLDHELMRAGFPAGLVSGSRTMWQFVTDALSAYQGLTVKPAGARDAAAMVRFLQRAMEVYRGLHVRKCMLRRELPLTVAYPVAAAVAASQNCAILDYEELIQREQKAKSPRVELRRSRRAGGAITV